MIKSDWSLEHPPQMAEEYLIVRVLRVDLKDNQSKGHHFKVCFGSMSCNGTDSSICFELTNHSRLFNKVMIDLHKGENGPVFSRAIFDVSDISDSKVMTIELKNVESTNTSLNDITPLPHYSPPHITLGSVDVQVMVVPGNAIDEDSMTVLKDSSKVEKDPQIKGAFESLQGILTAFVRPVNDRIDSMAKAYQTIVKYYQRRPYLPDYHYVSENRFQNYEKLKLAHDLFPFAIASIGWIGSMSVGQGAGLEDLLKSEFDLNAAVKFLGIHLDDVLRHEFSPKGLFKPSFVVFRSIKMNALVVAMRCSIDHNDFIADSICHYAEFMGGYSHSGVLKCAEWVYEQTADLLKDMKDFSKVYVTGHSLGAGISVLLSIMYQNRIAEYGKEIKCVALAPPPTVSQELFGMYGNIIDIYVHNEDIVPRLSYGGVVDQQTLQVYCAYLHDKKPDLEEDDMFKCLDACRKAIKEKSKTVKLGHPGNVILTCVINGKPIGISCPNDAFQEVRLSPRMVAHHFPNWYGWTIAELKKQAEQNK